MRLIVLSQRTQTINHATAHKKSAVLLMRIARGESVGILFWNPCQPQDTPHSKECVHHYWVEQ